MEWGRGCRGWEGRTAPLPPGLAPRPAPAVSTDGPAPVPATRPRGGRGRSGRRRRGGAGPGPVRSEGSRGALPARPVAASPGRTRRQLPHSPPRRAGGSRTPHPSHHPPHLGTPSPRPAPASPLPPQPSATSGPAVRAGGRSGGGAGAAAGRGGPAPPAHVLSLSRPRRYCRSGPGLRHGAPAAARLPARPALRQGKGWGRGMGGTAVVLGGAVGWGVRSPGPHGCTFPGAAGMGFWGHCGISHPVGRRIMRWDWGEGGLGITPLPSAPSPPQRCCRTPRTPLPVWSSSIWPQP